jgi:prepilin-type processing-associated H-X9-DG protein
MYTTDYDERTPGGCFAEWQCPTSPTRWINEQGQPSRTMITYTGLWPLTPYVKNEGVFLCPSVTGWNPSTLPYQIRPATGSYGSVYTIVCQGRSLAELERPAELVGYIDARLPWIDDLNGFYVHCRVARQPTICLEWSRSTFECIRCGTNRGDWHNEGVNCVYADGHARWSKVGQLTYKNFLVGLATNNAKYHCPITTHPNTCSNPGP